VCDAISVTLGPAGPDYPALDEFTFNFLNYTIYYFGVLKTDRTPNDVKVNQTRFDN
jgi:hypothetical protein